MNLIRYVIDPAGWKMALGKLARKESSLFLSPKRLKLPLDDYGSAEIHLKKFKDTSKHFKDTDIENLQISKHVKDISLDGMGTSKSP